MTEKRHLVLKNIVNHLLLLKRVGLFDVYCHFQQFIKYMLTSRLNRGGICLFRIISILSKVFYFRLPDYVILMEC